MDSDEAIPGLTFAENNARAISQREKEHKEKEKEARANLTKRRGSLGLADKFVRAANKEETEKRASEKLTRAKSMQMAPPTDAPPPPSKAPPGRRKSYLKTTFPPTDEARGSEDSGSNKDDDKSNKPPAVPVNEQTTTPPGEEHKASITPPPAGLRPPPRPLPPPPSIAARGLADDPSSKLAAIGVIVATAVTAAAAAPEESTSPPAPPPTEAAAPAPAPAPVSLTEETTKEVAAEVGETATQGDSTATATVAAPTPESTPESRGARKDTPQEDSDHEGGEKLASNEDDDDEEDTPPLPPPNPRAIDVTAGGSATATSATSATTATTRDQGGEEGAPVEDSQLEAESPAQGRARKRRGSVDEAMDAIAMVQQALTPAEEAKVAARRASWAGVGGYNDAMIAKMKLQMAEADAHAHGVMDGTDGKDNGSYGGPGASAGASGCGLEASLSSFLPTPKGDDDGVDNVDEDGEGGEEEELEWFQGWDESHEAYYYFNSTTQESRWVPPENEKYVACSDSEDESDDEEDESDDEDQDDDGHAMPSDLSSSRAWIPSLVTEAQCRTLVGELLFNQDEFLRLAAERKAKKNRARLAAATSSTQCGRSELVAMVRAQLSFELDEGKFEALARQQQKERRFHQNSRSRSTTPPRSQHSGSSSVGREELERQESTTDTPPRPPPPQEEEEEQTQALLHDLHRQQEEEESEVLAVRSRLFALEQAKAAAALNEDYVLCQRLKGEGEQLRAGMAEAEQRLRHAQDAVVVAMDGGKASSLPTVEKNAAAAAASPGTTPVKNAARSPARDWGANEGGGLVIHSAAELTDVFVRLLFDQEKFLPLLD